MAKTRKNRALGTEVAVPGAAAAIPAAPAPSAWILGPSLDLLLFIGAPLLVMAVFLPLRGAFSSREIAIFLLAFFTFGHHFPTFLRAYGDKELFERFRWRFLLAPPLIFLTALWFDDRQLHGLLIFVALWDIWHVLMQHYGFMRIYDSKAGAVNAATSWLDWGLAISWYVALIAVSPHYSHNLLSRAYQTGLPLVPAGAVSGGRTALLGLSALLTLAYVGYHLNEWRAGRPVSWRKLSMLGIFLGATWYLYVGLDDFLVGFTVWSAFHCIQYYGIVWAYNRNRVVKNGPVAGFVRFLFQPSLALVTLYAGLILAYGSINYFVPAVSDALLHRLLIAYVVTSNAMHYYFDGFIWKMRDKRTRADLDIADAGEAPPRVKAWLGQVARRIAPQNKGWQQAAYIGAVLVLFVGLERGRTADDVATAESLVAAAPELGEAQYNLGNALWRSGRLEEAQAAFERAAERMPESSKAFNNLGGVLYDQGRLDEAVAQYEQALSLYRDEDAQALRSSAPLMPGDAASLAARPSVVHANLAQALLRLERPEEAVEHYRLALESDPSSPQAQAGLGLAYSKLGRYGEAVAALRRALELDPGYASAHINLGGLLAYQGQLEQAAWHYNAAMASGDPRAQQAAASALAQLQAEQPQP
ncbi:MAG: tetratricopeptide repeat protein [Acidobacteria bacterium]|nr:tetratricopeptide repeat protein [Acidobacteriota bacterium]